jgi:chromosome segregation ATPase
MRVRQYESKIETHRLIEVKLEEQARTLKSQLEEKMELEVKLNLEIDRLGKEIDRMKQQLERFLRELTEKEYLIKMERERYE